MKRESSAFILHLSTEDGRIRICAAEKRTQTMKRCEYKDLSFERVDKLCMEILSILKRARRRGDAAGRTISDLKTAGRELLEELLTPEVITRLRSTASETLILEIDDQLVYIPWELLHDGDGFLCRRFNLGRTVTTRQRVASARRRKVGDALRMLIVADPRSDLDAAYSEGIKVRDDLMGREEQITIDLLSTKVSGQYVRRIIGEYDIVHYSGHAEYDREYPSMSGWLMADGRWTASDISRLEADGAFPFMIFSNACHSGYSGSWSLDEASENEIFGLANAFLRAGATHYIGTFLEVLDSPGSVFAVELYKALGENAPIGEAVRMARESLINLYGETNIIWTSYMLYGDPLYRISDESGRTPDEERGKLPGLNKEILIYAVLFILVLLTALGIKTLYSPPGNDHHDPPTVEVLSGKAGVKLVGHRLKEGAITEDALSQGANLRLFENIQFRIEKSRDFWSYIIIIDRRGQARLLFSSAGRGPEKVYQIPLSVRQLQLGAGTERIYVITSRLPLDGAELLMEDSEALKEGKSHPGRHVALHIEINDGLITTLAPAVN